MDKAIVEILNKLKQLCDKEGGISFYRVSEELFKSRKFNLLPVMSDILINDNFRNFIYTESPMFLVVNAEKLSIKKEDISLIDINVSFMKSNIESLFEKYDYSVDKLSNEEFITLSVINELMHGTDMIDMFIKNGDRITLTEKVKMIIESLYASGLDKILNVDDDDNEEVNKYVVDEETYSIQCLLNDANKKYTNIEEMREYLSSKGFLFVETASATRYKLPNFAPSKNMKLSLLISNGKQLRLGFVLFIVSDIFTNEVIFSGFRDVSDDYNFVDNPLQFLEEYNPKSDKLNYRSIFYFILIYSLNNGDKRYNYILNAYFDTLPCSDNENKYLVYKNEICVFIKRKKEGERFIIGINGIKYSIDKIVFEAKISYEEYSQLCRDIIECIKKENLSVKLEKLLNTLASKLSEKSFEMFLLKDLKSIKNKDDFKEDIKSYSLGKYEVLYDRCSKSHVMVLTNVDDFIIDIFN